MVHRFPLTTVLSANEITKLVGSVFNSSWLFKLHGIPCTCMLAGTVISSAFFINRSGSATNEYSTLAAVNGNPFVRAALVPTYTQLPV